ncbi:VOC family protein [Hephaestia sp. GCM10023244]|uniref:VOC family protein n=1 Tax=unclassified Hephaestia TaxID=2631281 RepID=UPI0020778B15|nr:VOC family protein [Hephaestia sp. MAHUQ-44]MCM8732264.1 VOC family protein [Hephaestia sp. MAHUQ-44]
MTEARPLNGLYHFAYPCRDAEETRHFYEDILGLPLVNCMMSEHVPSTGEEQPYVHFFFALGDGSYIAFFDLGGNEKPAPSPNTPDWVQHFAIETNSVDDVEAMRVRLASHGVKTTPLVDHGFVRSIYFFDPNGLRLEIAARTEEPGFLAQAAADAHDTLTAWNKRKHGKPAG